MKIVETHCHLDYLKNSPISEILSRSLSAGVDKLITISVEPSNQDTVLEIAKKYDNVFCTQGVHPHEASLWNDECEKKIIANAIDKNVCAIGEIGLDYHYDNSPRDIQRNIFEKQLELSIKFDLPIVIHTRKAENDTIAIIKNFIHSLKRKGVFHCFSSSMNLAKFALENDFHLGFNGIVTFKSSKNVKKILEATPLENILLETDAPFLAPEPYRGSENSPEYLPAIVEKMAELKNLPVDEIWPVFYKNSCDLFSI